MRRVFILICLVFAATGVRAESFGDPVRADLRPGWRLADGSHMAALHLSLAPGWKTYWRAPGDAGIPPLFDWKGAQAIEQVAVRWPAPKVFWQSGMRSVGYGGEVILPLHVSLRKGARDVRLRGMIDIGICRDVCIPHRVRVDAVLPATSGKPDGRIAAALANQPLIASDAGVGPMRCTIGASESGLTLRAEIAMPRKAAADTVIETADPQVWVSEPQTGWQGNTLVTEARLRHVTGGAFALDRSGVRLTILQQGAAIDVQGCAR